MKAKLLTDKVCPDFLYNTKDIDYEKRKVTLCWTTRSWNYNEVTVSLDDVELVKEEGDRE